MADAGKKTNNYKDYRTKGDKTQDFRPDRGRTEDYRAGKGKAKIVTKVVKKRS